MSGARPPWLWRLALRLLPEAFRVEFGGAMEETARARAGSRSGLGRVAFWWGESLSLVRVAWTERSAERRARMQSRGRRGTPMVDTVREIRFAARRLARARLFTAALLLTLALAVGAVLSIWAVVRNVVVDPLPYPDADRLIALEHAAPGVGAAGGLGVTTGLYVEYRRGAASIEAAGLYQQRSYTLTGAGEPVVLRAMAATATFGEVLAIPPMLGRWFTGDEGTSGGRQAAVLGHALWRDRFASDPGVLGRSMLLNGMPYEIVGVMGPDFRFTDSDISVWVALGEPVPERIGSFTYSGIGRLSRGATVERAKVEMDEVIRRLPQVFPSDPALSAVLDDARLTSMPRTLKDVQVGSLARTMWMLLASAGLVLLLGCANVANLFLVRAESRQAELAVRRALGAGRGGEFAQYLSEAMLLAVGGGLAGLAVAVAAVGALRARAPIQLPRVDEIRVDAGIVLAGLLLAALVGLVLSLLPLVRRTLPLASVLQDAARRSTGSARRVRARWLLVTTQVALAFVLLVSCGLMTRSFVHLSRVDPGFDAEGVVSFRVSLPQARYPEAAQAIVFHEQLLERLRSMPGVESASAITCGPLSGWCFGDPLAVEGREQQAGEATPVVAFRRVMPGYFETLGVRLIAGRFLEEADQQAGRAVAVISRRLSELYFPNGDALGVRVAQGIGGEEWVEIVGIVENTSLIAITEEHGGPLLYMPVRGLDGFSLSRHDLTYFVRAETAPLALVGSIRSAVHDMDPDLALASVQGLEQRVRESGARIAFTLVLVAIAAGAALLLAVIGIYGVISYSVSRRASEIGVRMALGARPGDVIAMIVRQGGVAAGAGLLLGIVAAIGFTRLMGALLFGVTPGDLPTWLAALAALGAVALLASWLPARRAAGADPLSALRAE